MYIINIKYTNDKNEKIVFIFIRNRQLYVYDKKLSKFEADERGGSSCLDVARLDRYFNIKCFCDNDIMS